jgi:uncharacterized glyoxalase superfamily protein PhnB
MQPIIAELTVEDVNVSIYWYKELGFQVDLEGIRDEDGLQWASLSLDGRAVWVLRKDISRHGGAHPSSVTFYLQVDDVDRVYNRLTERGISTETRPQNQWYGLREFIVRDPDGFCWAINESIPPDQTPPHPHTGRVGLL